MSRVKDQTVRKAKKGFRRLRTAKRREDPLCPLLTNSCYHWVFLGVGNKKNIFGSWRNKATTAEDFRGRALMELLSPRKQIQIS